MEVNLNIIVLNPRGRYQTKSLCKICVHVDVFLPNLLSGIVYTSSDVECVLMDEPGAKLEQWSIKACLPLVRQGAAGGIQRLEFD